MELLREYQEKFFNNNFIEKVKENSIDNNEYIQDVFKRSEYLLSGQIIFTDAMDMESTFTPYPIDKYKWKTTPNNDNEWCFMLNRHGFTLDLALSYILTKEEKYLFKWKELVFSFIQEEGEPNKENKLCWRPLDAGLRLSFWIRSLVYLGRENFTESEWKILLNSVEIHKEYLKSSFVDKYLLSNWGVLALSGLVLTILFEENGISNHKDTLERLKITTELQFTKMGIQWEQSPLYHHEVILNYAYILQISETLSLNLPFNLRKILKEYVNTAYYMADQKDYLLALNDSDYVDFSYVYDFYRGMNLLNDKGNKYLQNLKSQILLGDFYLNKLQEYKYKEYSKNFYDTEGGLVVIKDEDYYLTCFNGLHGSSHGQSSQGSITFNYQGKPVLIDCGRYSYTECKERINLNSDFSHNTVSLKNLKGTIIKDSWGYSNLAEPLGINFKDLDNISYIEMIWLANNKKEMALFRRNVFLIKDIKTLVLIDDVKFNHNDNMEVYLHLNEKVSIQQKENRYIEAKNLLIYSDGKIENHNTYHSPRYNKLEEHTVIKINGDNFIATVISLEKDLKIEKVPVYQNNQTEELLSCKGLKLELNGKIKEIYVNNSEIVEHDKLLVGENKHLFYGSVVVFEDGKRIRIK